MFLADTNLLSEPRQKFPDSRVIDWLAAHEEELFISAISLAEIQSGISILADGKKKAALQQWFASCEKSSTELFWILTKRWPCVGEDWTPTCCARGKKMPLEDSYIAATALEYDLAVATRNEPDFAEAGVQIINPWKE